jgi:hypothetical protein
MYKYYSLTIMILDCSLVICTKTFWNTCFLKINRRPFYLINLFPILSRALPDQEDLYGWFWSQFLYGESCLHDWGAQVRSTAWLRGTGTIDCMTEGHRYDRLHDWGAQVRSTAWLRVTDTIDCMTEGHWYWYWYTIKFMAEGRWYTIICMT